LSPSTSALGAPARKSSARISARAMPSGFSCTVYSMRMPQAEPSPSRRWNSGMSCGVEITMISRIRPSISTDSG
jgi:hypothetical protein